MKWFNLTYDDYLAIRNESKLALNLSPVIARDDIRAVSDYTSTNGQVSGVPSIYSQVRTIPLQVGRWINDQDDDEHRRVCVLGREMTRNMFPGRPPVGNTILLNGVRFEVIGVLSMIGHEEHNATNIRIFVPFNTMRELFPLKGDNSQQGNAISFINYQPRSFEENEEAKAELHRIVARNHGVSADYVRGMREAGMAVLDLDVMVSLRNHGVTPEYLKAMRAAGFSKLSPDEAIALRNHGVTSDFLGELRAAGYTGLSVDEAVALRNHGVTADFARKANASAGKRLSVDELIDSRRWRRSDP